jgi:hypothetical protein
MRRQTDGWTATDTRDFCYKFAIKIVFAFWSASHLFYVEPFFSGFYHLKLTWLETVNDYFVQIFHMILNGPCNVEINRVYKYHQTSAFFSVLITRSAISSVCYAVECPPVSDVQHAGTHKFCFTAACVLVCLFICLLGVKRHGNRPEMQNNAILLATSYQMSLNECLEF